MSMKNPYKAKPGPDPEPQKQNGADQARIEFPVVKRPRGWFLNMLSR
jgi:hypothetical protein